MFEVKKAKRSRRPMKLCLEGLSGSGKTFSALRLAFAMRRAGIGKKIVVADSENESAGLYDGIKIDGETWEYEVCPLPPSKQNPGGYADAYEYLIGQGFDLIIIDSMSHAWHGAMEQVDQIASRSGRNDKFQAWAVVTPAQRRMFQLITDPRAHLIATMRVKSEYERVEGNNGKGQIKKVGVKADQREGSEYEFDCVVRLEPEEHIAVVEKVRGCTAMDGKHGKCPGPDFWKPLFDWWLSAEPAKEEPKIPPVEKYRKAIGMTATLEALAVLWKAVCDDKEAGRMTKADLDSLVPVKDKRKAELSKAQPEPEGEYQGDHTIELAK